jgi:hypothetical protein
VLHAHSHITIGRIFPDGFNGVEPQISVQSNEIFAVRPNIFVLF